MFLSNILISFLIVSYSTVRTELTSAESKDIGNENDNASNISTEKIYAKLFLIRRKENKELVSILQNENAYERRYKLIDAGYNKLFKILQDARTIIESEKYDPMVDKFPVKNKKLVDAIVVMLANTCLFGEIVLRFPDMSYRSLQANFPESNAIDNIYWRNLINWCLKYSKHFYERIVDTKGQELLWLLDQEINPERRTANFVNPYRLAEPKHEHKKKPPKKLKKGPQLTSHDEL